MKTLSTILKIDFDCSFVYVSSSGKENFWNGRKRKRKKLEDSSIPVETPAHLYEFSSRGCISLGHFVKLTYTIRAEITSDNYRPYADEISTVPAQNSAKLR